MNAVIIRMAAAALAAATVVLLVVAALAALSRPDDPGGAVLSDDDRRALAAAPALRGADPAPVDPAVDLTDPDGGGARLPRRRPLARPGRCGPHPAPGHRVRPAGQSGGRRRRRARSAARRLPHGRRHRAGAAGASGERRGYRAALRTETARPGGPVAVARQQALVVLARSPDGRWRVVAETTGDPDLPVGED